MPRSYIKIAPKEWMSLKKDVEQEKSEPYLSKIVALEHEPANKKEKKERIQFLLENGDNLKIEGNNFEVELGSIANILTEK